MLQWGTHKLMLPLIRIFLTLPEFPYTQKELGMLPQGSLGKELFNFLESRNLHLLKDYESHDIKHVLFGYDSSEEGEAAMQFFFFGNGFRSFPVLVTVIITLIIMPEHYSLFRKAYRRGRLTPHIGHTNWFALLTLQTEDIKKQLQIPL